MDSTEPQNEDTGSPSGLAASRSRRNKPDKFGRLAALQKLKGLKGSKNKYEVSTISNVYEEVDEREYSKRRRDKMEEDWIIDDDGSGYVEDGREIFDEEDDDEDIFTKKKGVNRSSKSGKKREGDEKGRRNIKDMFSNMPAKRKAESNATLEGDSLLDDILQDFGPSMSKKARPSKSPSKITPTVNPFIKKKSPPRPVVPHIKPSLASPSTMNSPRSVKQSDSSHKRPNTPIDTTPVRRSGGTIQPRSVLRENITTPKAKRSLQINDDTEKTIKEETEDDFADMDFENLDDMDFEPPVVTEKSKPPPPSTSTVPNRGFTQTAQESSGEKHSLTSDWDGSVFKTVEETPQITNLSSSSLPLIKVEGDKVLRMYWFDAYEDPYKSKGTVYLFGKVWIESAKQHTSCCVLVKNINRRIFLLPRTERINLKTKEVISDSVSMKDVYDEFNSLISSRFGVREFKSRVVKKLYAFDNVDVPHEAEYLEVLYSAEHESVPPDFVGETFSGVFGHSSSSLENLLITKKIKGPCWLDVAAPKESNPNFSWCKVEAVSLSPSQVKLSPPAPPPPLTVACLSVRTALNAKSHQNEVTAISCFVHNKFALDKPPPNPPFMQHFCAITKPEGTIWPTKNLSDYKQTKVEKMDKERALLNFFLAKLQNIDPDVLVGHDIMGNDLGIILHRLSANKISHWSRIGRLHRKDMPKLSTRSGYGEKAAVCGRLICDTKVSAQELIRAKSYDLGPLAAQILRVKEVEDNINPTNISNKYESTEQLFDLINLTMQKSYHTLKIMCELNVLPLALQITSIAGNVLSRTLLGGRAERNEYLLLHAFSERNYIPPDKLPFGAQKKAVPGEGGAEEGTKPSGKNKKASYAGGLVLDPKRGFYDKYILLMDFNSLYPSIIQEYNICFTTVERKKKITPDDNPLADLPEPDQSPGVLPTEIRKLVESRRKVKDLMKNSDISHEMKMQYDIRQKALKLTANSMYGCLGFSHSRFHASHLAAMITGKGREILLQTRDLVQRMNFDVIYGDTDSIMINTNCDDYDMVYKLGAKIKTEVNKLYKQLELEVDGVFKYMLLLKKKKYAALTISRLPNGKLVTERELKGLDIVRRDWSQLATNAGKYAVDNILSDLPLDERVASIHTYLETLALKLKEGKVELSELVITKQLTKRPEDYPDKASLPHVQVALRLATSGNRRLRQGDTVPYVICLDGTNNTPSQRAYHPDELKAANSSLSIDTDYYLAQQLHPVVARLCDPIEGSDASRIAECLGLDPGNYRNSRHYGGETREAEGEEGFGFELPPEERFRGCSKFTFKCPSAECDTSITMDAPFRQGIGSTLEVCLESCPNPKCKHPLYTTPAPIINAVSSQLRAFTQLYYKGFLVCEDPSCTNRTRRMPLNFVQSFPVCNLCRKGVLMREYTESQLYKQLCFYDYIFDFQKACQGNKDERIRLDHLRKVYASVREVVTKHLAWSAYSQVNLGKLFENLRLRKK